MSPKEFEYIRDPVVKKECESDLAELKNCMSQGAWKASIVLSGSLIEAILYDVMKSFANRHQLENKKVTLYDLLRWSREVGVIDDGVFKFADQIRDYRNLIHPNVYIRQELEINPNVAKIAYNVLLEVIRLTKKHVQKFSDDSVVNAVKTLIQDKFDRSPANSEIFIYVPILKKYGIKKGSQIVLRSIEYGTNP